MSLQTKGSYDFVLHSYDSYSSYMDFTLKERMTQTAVSFGFALPGLFEFGFNYNSAKYSKSVKKLRRVSGKVRLRLCSAWPCTQSRPWPHRAPRRLLQSYSFIRAKAQLELAQYMLKSDDLMLHPDFLHRLRSLPQSYVYGEYRQIFRDYGTHYTTEAALGGEFEYTIILDKEQLEKSGNPASTLHPPR